VALSRARDEGGAIALLAGRHARDRRRPPAFHERAGGTVGRARSASPGALDRGVSLQSRRRRHARPPAAVSPADRPERAEGVPVRDRGREDLEERDVNQYSYALQGEDVIDGAAFWRIESTPLKTKSSQYTRAILWIRHADYAIARIENYAKDKIVRRLDYSNIENVQGILTARQLEMTDLVRGSRTRLSLENLQYNAPLKDESFTLQALRRQ